MSNSARDKQIGRLLDQKRLSYALIAQKFGVTRNVVAGIAFRRKHPITERIPPAGYPGWQRNMIGTGYQYRSYWPEKTVANTR